MLFQLLSILHMHKYYLHICTYIIIIIYYCWSRPHRALFFLLILFCCEGRIFWQSSRFFSANHVQIYKVVESMHIYYIWIPRDLILEWTKSCETCQSFSCGLGWFWFFWMAQVKDRDCRACISNIIITFDSLFKYINFLEE